ncbi:MULTISPECIES: hypothetical protein [Sinorhizobium]|uniref:Uncharacterized protein n=2 Tax=Sinorhizobium TaxID=28105 RepID=A0A6N7LK07_SINTE|nr:MULTISPECIES: hypothetical protein [Sinorhizobium]MBB4189277.1 hypothetical protein [Sinorhizobium terangae]MCZ4093474.1 hypothetical protein [Sinorhizobium psoraleae]MQX18203.1 hypothetical protein [Sinorhizobium terangae]
MDGLKEYTLLEFLREQGTNFRTALPIVHSSESKNLIRMLTEEKVAVTECDTFCGENLAYFFHGRPAYRRYHARPKQWQLPFVLVLKSTCLLTMKRVFPFDSGAFFSGRLPDYLSEFDPAGYELSENDNPIDLLIDIFFGSDRDYFFGNTKPTQEVVHRKRLNIRHSEIMALCSMYNGEQLETDDRTLTIELQSDRDVSIKDQLLGVVMPRPYFDDKVLKALLKSRKVIAKSTISSPAIARSGR